MISKSDSIVIIPHQEITSNNLNLSVISSGRQLINIRVTDLLKGIKISTWEDIVPGKNEINLDLSALPKGFYRVLVTMDKGKVLFNDFTKY